MAERITVEFIRNFVQKRAENGKSTLRSDIEQELAKHEEWKQETFRRWFYEMYRNPVGRWSFLKDQSKLSCCDEKTESNRLNENCDFVDTSTNGFDECSRNFVKPSKIAELEMFEYNERQLNNNATIMEVIHLTYNVILSHINSVKVKGSFKGVLVDDILVLFKSNMGEFLDRMNRREPCRRVKLWAFLGNFPEIFDMDLENMRINVNCNAKISASRILNTALTNVLKNLLIQIIVDEPTENRTRQELELIIRENHPYIFYYIFKCPDTGFNVNDFAIIYPDTFQVDETKSDSILNVINRMKYISRSNSASEDFMLQKSNLECKNPTQTSQQQDSTLRNKNCENVELASILSKIRTTDAKPDQKQNFPQENDESVNEIAVFLSKLQPAQAKPYVVNDAQLVCERNENDRLFSDKEQNCCVSSFQSLCNDNKSPNLESNINIPSNNAMKNDPNSDDEVYISDDDCEISSNKKESAAIKLRVYDSSKEQPKDCNYDKILTKIQSSRSNFFKK